MSKLCRYSILITLLFSVNLVANDRPGALFMLIPPGAKAVGMGSAFTALGDDPSSLHYNPGTLGFYDRFGFLIMNQGLPPGLGRLFEIGLLTFIGHVLYNDSILKPEPDWLWPNSGMRYIYSAYVIPFNKIGNLGLSYTYLNTGLTEIYDVNGTYLGSYETYDYAWGLSYGRNFFNRIGLGITFKYIYSSLAPDWVVRKMPELGIERWGIGKSVGFDFGAIYKIYGVGAGVSLQNLGPRMKYSNATSDRLPTRIRWGISVEPMVALDTLYSISRYKIFDIPINDLFGVKFSYDRSYDLEVPDDVWKCSGWEFTFLKYLSYRRGSFMGMRTYGLGLNLRNVEVDIAKYPFGNNYFIQITLHAIEPPAEIKNNPRLNRLLTIASATLAPGGGQFYKGEGIKGSLFFVPSLYLGNYCFSTNSKTNKTWTLIAIGALYVTSTLEALLN